MGIRAVSVTQLNGYIKRILATDPILCNVSVAGEITNLTKHSSGHWYFSLKDENSSLRCFLPKDRIDHLRFDLEEGMKITAAGYISVFERGGSYSLNIRDIDIEGEGELKKAFDLLVKKLDKEGLFDAAHKRKLPVFPKHIGVVTSPTGAAIHDIIRTLQRRNPMVDLILYPCIVQGPEAADTIIRGIKTLNTQFPDLDLMIVGRGGGSAEDLWPFNEEKVARAVYESKIPVISAVGHEVDTVITDLTADLRAATPTAAAELAAPDLAFYQDIINRNNPVNLFGALKDNLENSEQHVQHLKEMLDINMDHMISKAQHHLNELKLIIDSYNPFGQLKKGYAIVKNENQWISSIHEVYEKEPLSIMLKDGSLSVTVEEVHGKENKI